MRKKIILPGLFLLLGSIFTSCEKTIEFNLNDIKSLIVVNGTLNPENQIRIEVKKSLSVLEERNFYETIPNATVKIYEDGVFLEELAYAGKIDTFIEYQDYGIEVKHPYPVGFYYSENIVPKSGSTYKIEIACIGFDPVMGETKIPFPVLIDESISSMETKNNDYGGQTIFINAGVNFTEPINENNYYRFYAFAKRGIELKIMNNHHYGGGFSEYGSYGNPENQFNPDDFIPSDTIVEMADFTGFLASYDPLLNRNASTDILGTESEFTNMFSDELINGKNYTLSFYYLANRPLYTEFGEYLQTDIILETISEELFLYMKSADRQYQTSHNEFSEPTPVFSNITGGLGVFGSAARSYSSSVIGEYPMDDKTYVSYDSPIYQNN